MSEVCRPAPNGPKIAQKLAVERPALLQVTIGYGLLFEMRVPGIRFREVLRRVRSADQYTKWGRSHRLWRGAGAATRASRLFDRRRQSADCPHPPEEWPGGLRGGGQDGLQDSERGLGYPHDRRIPGRKTSRRPASDRHRGVAVCDIFSRQRSGRGGIRRELSGADSGLRSRARAEHPRTARRVPLRAADGAVDGGLGEEGWRRLLWR